MYVDLYLNLIALTILFNPWSHFDLFQSKWYCFMKCKRQKKNEIIVASKSAQKKPNLMWSTSYYGDICFEFPLFKTIDKIKQYNWRVAVSFSVEVYNRLTVIWQWSFFSCCCSSSFHWHVLKPQCQKKKTLQNYAVCVFLRVFSLCFFFALRISKYSR